MLMFHPSIPATQAVDTQAVEKNLYNCLITRFLQNYNYPYSANATVPPRCTDLSQVFGVT